MAPHLGNEDWRSLAEQASKEMDPARLTMLVEKLCCELEGDRRDKSRSADTPRGSEPSSFRSD
jgi:hypothetical protein